MKQPSIKFKPDRGIALITVLIVAGLLMILLGSFARVNQQHFGMLKNDQSHAAATQTAYSAFDYCSYKLEHNREWGASPFKGESENYQNLLTLQYADGKSTITGTSKETRADFEADILNNIEGAATVDGVEKGFCRIRITAKRGTAEVTCEALLQTAPIFDGSVVASQNIQVDAESFTMESTDPFRNRLRAKNSIMVPDYGRFQLRPKTASGATERGVLWAKNDISIGGRNLRNPDNAAEAARRTGGQFYPGATTHHDVYDLKINQVKASQNIAQIDSGVYVFGQRNVSYTSGDETKTATIAVLERRDWAVDTNGELDINRSNLREVWYLADQLPADADSDWLTYYRDVPNDGMHPVSGTNSFDLVPHPDSKPDSKKPALVSVDFNSLNPNGPNSKAAPKITVNGDVNLSVAGDFGVASDDPLYSPVLAFQDQNDLVGAITTSKATDFDPLTGKGDKKGSIYIEGKIEGNAKFLAEGDVTIKNTFANVKTDELSDLSIYSGGSVKIHPKLAKSGDDVIQELEGHTAFRGLIYAKQDVSINAFGAVESDYWSNLKKPHLRVEGAIVAREGSVHIDNFQNALVNYNPDFLDTILKKRVDDYRIRLERVVWKES